MIHIDRIAYSSKLKQKNPLEKLFFALLTLGVCLWANSVPVSLLTLLIMTWASVYKGGTSLFLFLKLLCIPMAFLIMGVLAIALEITVDPRNLVFAIPLFGHFLGVSGTGMTAALGLFLRALGAVACLYYLSLNTPMVDLLSSLKKLKCPQLLLELMSLIYRFIFVLLETAEIMITAQNSRLGYSGLAAGYRSMGALISTLFIRAYKRSDDIYTALEARGYEGEIRVLEEEIPFSRTGFLKGLGINLFLILIAFTVKEGGVGL